MRCKVTLGLNFDKPSGAVLHPMGNPMLNSDQTKLTPKNSARTLRTRAQTPCILRYCIHDLWTVGHLPVSTDPTACVNVWDHLVPDRLRTADSHRSVAVWTSYRVPQATVGSAFCLDYPLSAEVQTAGRRAAHRSTTAWPPTLPRRVCYRRSASKTVSRRSSTNHTGC